MMMVRSQRLVTIDSWRYIKCSLYMYVCMLLRISYPASSYSTYQSLPASLSHDCCMKASLGADLAGAAAPSVVHNVVADRFGAESSLRLRFSSAASCDRFLERKQCHVTCSCRIADIPSRRTSPTPATPNNYRESPITLTASSFRQIFWREISAG